MKVMPVRCWIVAQLGPHVLAQLEVQGRQRLVEQEHLGLDRQRPGDRDPLLLAARKLVDPPVAVAGQRDQLEHLLDLAVALGPRHAAHVEPEGDVVRHGHQREQGEVLEDQRRRAAVGADAAQGPAAQPDLAFGGLDEPGDHAQDRGLAAARGAEEGEELPFRDGQVDVAHGREGAEALRHTVELEIVRHRRRRLAGAPPGPRRRAAPGLLRRPRSCRPAPAASPGTRAARCPGPRACRRHPRDRRRRSSS